MSTIDGVVLHAGIMGFLPSFLRPVISQITSQSTYQKLAKLERKYGSIFKERIRHMESFPEDTSKYPVDLQQKMLRYAQKNCPAELATNEMTRRLLMANLGFIYQASFALSNMLMKIIESDIKYNTLQVLRLEATKSLAAGNSDPAVVWTKPNIARMVYADSAARETLRLNAVATRAIVRNVMVDGVITDQGVPLPRGSLVSFVSQPLHTDSELFPDPHSFDPFRFVRLREQVTPASSDANAKGWQGVGSGGEHSFLSTSNLLIFGRGRNACPGKNLVDFQVKMLISHLVTNYDIKFPDAYKGKRPGNRWIMEFIFPLPSVGAKV